MDKELVEVWDGNYWGWADEFQGLLKCRRHAKSVTSASVSEI